MKKYRQNIIFTNTDAVSFKQNVANFRFPLHDYDNHPEGDQGLGLKVHTLMTATITQLPTWEGGELRDFKDRPSVYWGRYNSENKHIKTSKRLLGSDCLCVHLYYFWKWPKAPMCTWVQQLKAAKTLVLQIFISSNFWDFVPFSHLPE